MGDIKFNVDSWFKAAKEMESDASTFASSASGPVNTMSDAGPIGCKGGPTLADTALELVLGAFGAALSQTVTGITEGIRGEASMVQAAGEDYAAVEEDNEVLTYDIFAELG